MTPAEAFGKVLRQLRKEAGLTQEGLALETGMQRNFISLMELGQKQLTITSIVRLSVSLGKPAGEIVAMVESRLLESSRR